MNAPRITKATIYYAKDPFDLSFLMVGNGGSAYAQLEWDNGDSTQFAWYHDELTYVVGDFIGLTAEELWEMHRRKDIAYLRS